MAFASAEKLKRSDFRLTRIRTPLWVNVLCADSSRSWPTAPIQSSAGNRR
jgi:hypothetical protein